MARTHLTIGLASLSTLACCDAGAGPANLFRPVGAPVSVGPMPTRPVVTDLDGDGDMDVVIICGPCCGREPDATSGHARILRNDGQGRLSVGPRIPLGPTALGGAAGDLNHDGHPDVVAFHHSSYDLALLLNDGSGGLASPRSIVMPAGESPHVHSVAIADVNNDTHPDLLATLVDDHALAVLLNDGRANFTPALGQPFFAHQHPYAQLNATDINGDGSIDAVLTDLRGGGLTVLVGSGTGMFSPLLGFDLETRMPITAAERPMACTLADLDADGDQDAVAFIDESPLVVRMINEGGGRYVEPDRALVDLRSPSTGGLLVDVTGDELADIVASGTTTEVVTICPGRADATFDRAFHINVGGTSPSVAVADMNGDGRPDLITGNYDSGTVSVLLRTEVNCP